MSSATKPAEVAIPTGADEMRKFLKRAENGDESTLPVLWKMLKDPATVDRFGGNLAYQAELALIRASVGDNLAFREALVRKLELLRADLAGKAPTPIERLLVERVVACWLQVQVADIRTAQGNDLSLPWAEYYQHRMNHAHRRYLSALKALALVRKLAVPVLKVDLPPKHVNGSDPGPDWQQERVRTNGRFHRENGTVADCGTVLTIAPNRTGMARMEPR